MRLRLASYNIHKAVGLDQRRDPERILQVIMETGADVIALQEVDRRLGPRPTVLPPDLIASATDYHVVPFARTEVSLGWHGNAILVKPNLSVKRLVRIPLPGLEPRGAVRATVSDGELSLTVFGVHLGLLREWRTRQLTRLVAKADVAGGPVALVGDFNEWSTTTGCEALEPMFEVLAPGPSFHAARPIASLDRIAVTRQITVPATGVHATPLARMASDHLPVWADLDVSM
ncbi:MAG: endonuclease/exonuclease/phosphatase family protein [Rhodobacteraceae bacterium]|nr:endonuclease/exonuclease/phosphatase family protein [Paracoccaceae bacterium]